MSWFSKTLTVLTVGVVLASAVRAAEQGDVGYQPTEDNLAAREWFQDAKFGMFVHWGIFSVYPKYGWNYVTDKVTFDEWATYFPKFNPVKFDPDEWCRMMKDAGMRYITITTKQHDGFVMFDSKVTDYDAVDQTPFKRDLMKMLADACERHGIKLFFYYSQADWHHTDYYPRGKTGSANGRPDSGDWNKYLDYMDAQLRELCTHYGKIAGIWFDGMWDRPDADWRLGKTYALIHELQPQALVGSNHHRTPFAGEDIQMFEKGLPGKDPYNREGISALPLETCETVNDNWNYLESDTKFKTVKELVQFLVKAAGNNSNLLLDVGPKGDGTIQPESKERLAGMGKWLRANGESIYGTRGGPLPPQSWGVTTQKPDVVYLHVLSETDSVIALPRLDRDIKTATLLNGTPVKFAKTELGTIVQLREKDAVDTVVVLRFH